MGKKKAVKLGINLGQYPNEGGEHLSQPNQINKVPGRLPFKNQNQNVHFLGKLLREKNGWRLGLFWDFFMVRGEGECPSPNLFTPKKWEFFRKK